MLDNCHIDANCTNTDGGFECECYDGFSGNGTYCEDVNECSDPSLNQCHQLGCPLKRKLVFYITDRLKS